jgi:hypothetical protein
VGSIHIEHVFIPEITRSEILMTRKTHSVVFKVRNKCKRSRKLAGIEQLVGLSMGIKMWR